MNAFSDLNNFTTYDLGLLNVETPYSLFDKETYLIIYGRPPNRQ